ncbi:MAG: discoidin domain-containing protein [Flavobacteriales bacterium]|nr:discoidin domain-containing protein [Flavobacteriales bacterium]
MKSTIPLLLLLSAPLLSMGQCDTVAIAQTGWSATYVDSEELIGEGASNGHAVDCIDNDPLTFWHTQWQGASPGFPHEIHLDLGAVHAVNGISLLSRDATAAGKAKNYALYLSLDGTNWGAVQSAGDFTYADLSAGAQRGSAYFGAVDARYVRLVVNSGYSGGPYLMVAELDLFEYTGPGCTPSGQSNQITSIQAVADQSSTAPAFALNASASSGLPVSYSVVSGPASVAGSMLTLDGTAGTVTVRAEQAGDATWYPASATTTFNVLDLSSYDPVVSMKLTENYPVQMPELHPYAFYATANIDEPGFNSITSVVFHVDGTDLPAAMDNGAYTAWWTPNAYGTHVVTVTATASNGNSANEALNIQVVNTAVDQTIATFNGDVINFDGSGGSQWYTGSYTLPQSVGAYDHIIAHLAVSCPSVAGGCDDWDRVAWVEAKAPNGEWTEIIRYITPYGVPCDHSIDVTDLASILQGNTEIRMFIETWGSGGWKLDLDFTYEAGTPEYLYSTVQQVWHGNYNFGDPTNLQPMDTVQLEPGIGVANASIRLVTTGHGWGANNTANAAEFYHANHHVFVNGTHSFTQDLWTDCNPNPDGCSPQYGTWQYDRAGWCPGSIAAPFEYDVTPYLSEAPFALSYIFQESYMDACNPGNPNCISGTTCADCNDGYNPYYRVGCYLISRSNAPIALGISAPTGAVVENGLTISPNPSDGHFAIHLQRDIGRSVVTLHDISGKTLKTWFFNSNDQLANYGFDISKLAKGTYFLKVHNEQTLLAGKVVVR